MSTAFAGVAVMAIFHILLWLSVALFCAIRRDD
jgi:hypothetical protein